MLIQNLIKKSIERLLYLSVVLALLLIGGLAEANANISKPLVLNPKWYKITHKAENDPGGFGSPMAIKKIEYRGKKWNCSNKYCYTYGITIKRPGNDKGNGILMFGAIPFSIEYWVGNIYPNVYGFDLASTISGGYNVTKLQTKRNELTLVFNKAFVPGKYNLKIAPFPYPTVYGSTLMKFIEYYRSDYKSFADEASKYYKFANVGYKLADAMYGLVGGKVQDITVNTILITIINKLGVHLVLNIPAVMPFVIGMDVKQAHSELLKSSLRPEPRNWECTTTQNQHLFGKVFKAQYPSDTLLSANTQVIYEYYCPRIVVPNIKGMSPKDADRTLRKLGLIPAPGKCVPTYHKKLDNKVFRYQDNVKTDHVVAYKYYCYNEINKNKCTCEDWDHNGLYGVVLQGQVLRSNVGSYNTCMKAIQMLYRCQSITTSGSTHLSFIEIMNAGIPGYNNEILENVSIGRCKKACTKRSWCKSVDYERKVGRCFLQPVNKFDVKLRTDYPGNPYDHYYRQ